MQRNASFARVLVLVGTLAGCGSSEPPLPAGCPQDNEIRGVCAGVPAAAICDGETCTASVACMGITQVGSDAELEAAAAQAMSGACLALAPGSYHDVELPGGVSLLGKSAADVTLGKVTLGKGQGAVLRGFTASAIRVNGATGAKIESVHVVNSEDTGVLVAAQSSVTVVTSTIEASAIYGIYALDSLELSLDRVIIAGSGGPGLWVASSSDCATPLERPVLDAKSSIVRKSHVVGVALFGVKATIRGVDILATIPGDTFHYGLLGGGLSIASCSDADAKGVRVHDNKSFGVLVDASAATLGGTGPDEEVEIHRNVIGLSIQHVTGSFHLENAQLDQNQGFGIGLSGGSQGVVICKSGVTNTASKFLPTVNADTQDVGDGLVWVDKSSAMITELALSGNALASVLIDGEAGGTLDEVTLSGGDQALGIVQQNFTNGAQPMVKNGTPAAQVSPGEVHPVPVMPDALPKNL